MESEALRVACRYCGAQKRGPCIPENLPYQPRDKPHATRVRAAERKETPK